MLVIGVTTAWGTVLKGCRIRKAENHCSRALHCNIFRSSLIVWFILKKLTASSVLKMPDQAPVLVTAAGRELVLQYCKLLLFPLLGLWRCTSISRAPLTSSHPLGLPPSLSAFLCSISSGYILLNLCDGIESCFFV